MKIGTRLTLGFIVILLMLMSLVFFGINRMGLLSDQTTLIYNHPLTVSNAVLRINTTLIKIHREIKDIAFLENMEQIKEHSQLVDDYEQQIFNDFEIIKERFLGDKEKYSIALEEFTEWKTIRDEIINLMILGESKEAVTITMGKCTLHLIKVEQAMEELGDFAQNKAKEFLHSAKTTKSIAFNMMYVFICIAVLVVIALAIFLTRSISRPIEIIKTATDKIGRGELNTKISLDSKDELGELATSFNKMTEDLKTTTVKSDKLLEEFNKRILAEETTRDSEKRFHSIVESASDAIININSKGDIIFWNHAAENIFGYSSEEVVGRQVTLIIPEEFRDAHLKGIERVIKTKETKVIGEIVELVGLKKNGSEFPIELSLSSWNMTVDIFFTAIIRDITERKRKDEQLKHQAFYDQLTSLPNRANFLSYLERMLKRTKWKSDYLFAVLFIDLDNFKVVNDSLGHLIGDKLLVEVARRLDESIRVTDRVSRAAGNDRVSRFGGDEFSIFLHDVKDISSASRVTDRIQIELQKSFNIDGHELYTSASIGIALSATGYKNAEDILRDADSAMYRAKDTGKAHAEIFDEAMHVRVTEILELEADLRTAVEKEQFMVYYQPIVSATDSRITGAEALIRWNHPEKGFISPMDFIPIAEETGLISKIGEWVLRTACAQNKAWQDAGYPNLLMKVNFSSRQFKDKNLTELVKKAIRETNMPAQLLDVEITESIAMADNSIEILNQLTAMGLQISIDDFGTGYSSLGSLTKFPINTIKIDRAFIKEITIDVNAKAIIKAIIAMAHSLNMEVVAEGVETEEQLAYLQSQKCDKIQGYLFSPPVPEEEFRKLLEQEKNGSPVIQKLSESMV